MRIVGELLATNNPLTFGQISLLRSRANIVLQTENMIAISASFVLRLTRDQQYDVSAI